MRGSTKLRRYWYPCSLANADKKRVHVELLLNSPDSFSGILLVMRECRLNMHLVTYRFALLHDRSWVWLGLTKKHECRRYWVGRISSSLLRQEDKFRIQSSQGPSKHAEWDKPQKGIAFTHFGASNQLRRMGVNWDSKNTGKDSLHTKTCVELSWAIAPEGRRRFLVR